MDTTEGGPSLCIQVHPENGWETSDTVRPEPTTGKGIESTGQARGPGGGHRFTFPRLVHHGRFPYGATVETMRGKIQAAVCDRRTSDAKKGDAHRAPLQKYQDIPGFCKSANLDEIRAHGYVLTPGRYVGAAETVDDGEPFGEKMKRLTGKLEEQFAESTKLQTRIRTSLHALEI